MRGGTDRSVMMRRALAIFVILCLPVALAAQSIRGKVLAADKGPLLGALVEVRDATGKSLKIILTSSSGTYQVDVPNPGRYSYRVAAIGYQPLPWTSVDVPAAGVILPDVTLKAMAMRLPDLVAMGNSRFCGKDSKPDETFSRVLESAQSALQIMETTVNQKLIRFEVGILNTRTVFGAYNNFTAVDTSLVQLAVWPIMSIDPDTLRAVGFGRTLMPNDENTRVYYGPDARILFSEWFLDGHCFTVDKPKKNQSLDSLRIHFTPSRKSKLIDVAGELILDAHNLALLQFSFVLKNLPGWMPDEAAGGYMEFSPMRSGLWMSRTWAIWAPIGGVAAGRQMRVGGQVETYGFVVKMIDGRDSTVIQWPH
jgi:hypothetical protein